MTKYTEQEVRDEAKRWSVYFKTAEMLTAHADLLAAQPAQAEPVAWISEVQCIGPQYKKQYFGPLPIQSLQPGFYKHYPLYAHPPAQPVAVPDAIKLDEWLHDDEYAYGSGWNDCRKAMLAATSPAAEGAKAAAAQCETCGGTGEVGGPFGQTPDSFGYDSVSCPDSGTADAQPVVFIQPNHLQHAKTSPFLCRVAPTQIEPDFVPLYVAPVAKPAEVLSDEQIQNCFPCGGGMNEYGEVVVTPSWLTKFARAIERAVLAQPSGGDERADFEDEVRKHFDPDRAEEFTARDDAGNYEEWPIALAWDIWQARAASTKDQAK